MKKLFFKMAVLCAAVLLLMFTGCKTDDAAAESNETGGGEVSGIGTGGGTTGGENSGDHGSSAGESPIKKPDQAVLINAEVEILESAGGLNSAYVIFKQVKNTEDSADFTVKCDGVELDAPLIRFYDEYVYYKYDESTASWNKETYFEVVRADALGLKAGSHEITVCTKGNDAKTSKATMQVVNHDRSGFAFVGTQTPGAYNADGTLKQGAKVIYVTNETAKTVTYNGQTGLQAILSETSLKKLDTPLCIRVIGTIKDTDMDALDSSAEGLQIKNNKSPITFEGVGHDAAVTGFGFLLRSAQYVELSNLGIFNCMDDGISIDTNNEYLWIHNNDIFYGKAGGDSDQAKGDGALDFKKSQYGTLSYNHFWDNGKSCLLDASAAASGGSNYLTYHHNWFDHSDSRHPRIRNASAVHVYNNYYDGNAKYGIGITSGASCFAEGNYFRNVKYPMMSSKQGSDISWGNQGTFSGETGGIIKSFGNVMVESYTFVPYGAENFVKAGKKQTADIETNKHFDAYVVQTRNESVPQGVVTLEGGTSYSNFDTERGDAGLGLKAVPTTAETAKSDVIAFAGRRYPDFAWTFNNATEDANYSVINELKTAVTNYKTQLVKVQGYIADSQGSAGGNTETDNTGSGTTPTIITGNVIAFTEKMTNKTFDLDFGTVTVTGNMKSGIDKINSPYNTW